MKAPLPTIGFVICAAVLCASAADARQPSAGSLAADIKAITSCLDASERPEADKTAGCVRVVQTRCEKDASSPDAVTTASSRACERRAIAAWESVLEEAVATLRKEMAAKERGAFAAAQKSWEVFMVENVRAHAARYAGGTLELLVAGQERARMTAERAIELRRMIRERRDGGD